MLPVLFQIGPLTIYSFGFLMATGFLVSTFLFFRQVQREYLNEERVFDTLFISILAGILGARVFYIIEHFDNFGFSFLDWILINARPGFSLWGGIGTGTAVFLIYLKKEKLPLFKMFDIITLPLTVSFMLGFLGLFFAGGEVGTPTSLPWGVVFFSTLKRHPVSLYKTLVFLITLITLIKLDAYYRKKRIPEGCLFFSFLIIHSFLMFLISFLKEDVIVIGRFFKLDHFIYFMLLSTGIILFYRRLGRNFGADLLLLKTKIKTKIKSIFTVRRRINEKISG